jgi:hypothetical protein
LESFEKETDKEKPFGQSETYGERRLRQWEKGDKRSLPIFLSKRWRERADEMRRSIRGRLYKDFSVVF